MCKTCGKIDMETYEYKESKCIQCTKGRSYIQYVVLIISWLIVPPNIFYRSKLITNSMTHQDLVLPSITIFHKF